MFSGTKYAGGAVTETLVGCGSGCFMEFGFEFEGCKTEACGSFSGTAKFGGCLSLIV